MKFAVILRRKIPKNDNDLLPLDESESYLVVGEMFEKMRYQGAGSSRWPFERQGYSN